MMGVVVDDGHTACLTERLEPAAGPGERRERPGGLRRRRPKRVCGGDGRRRVERVVHPGHTQHDPDRGVAAQGERERETVGTILRRGHAVLRGRDAAVRPRGLPALPPRLGERGRDRVVGACDERTSGRDTTGERGEGVADIGDGREDVHVVVLDIEHGRDRGREREERAVVFVRLDDEDVARPRVRVRSGVAEDRPADERRVDAPAAQRGPGHRGRRALAVRARDRDDAPPARELAPGVLTLPYRDPARASRGDLRVPIAVRARPHDHVRASDVRGVERRGDARAVAREGVRQRPVPAVGAADHVAAGEQEPRDRGHPGAADPDDVVARAHPHPPSARSSAATWRAASGRPAVRAAAAMRRRRSRSSRRPVTIEVTRSPSSSLSWMTAAAPASATARAFASWWASAAGPNGTGTIGVPKASGSAIEDEPARPTNTSAAASAAPISSRRKPRGRYRSRSSAGRFARRASARARFAAPTTWMTTARRSSRARAAKTASFSRSEPWLPPVTRTTASSGPAAKASRPLSRFHARRERRIGVPTTAVRPRGSERFDSSNVVPTRAATRARSRFVRPGTTLPPQRYTGTPAARAPRTAGSETRPPVVQHTEAWKRSACHQASTAASGRTKARRTSDMRESGSRRDGIAVAWNGISAARTRSASSPRRPPMKRSAVSGSVSRNASATASSGLTCPPVPPPTRSTRQPSRGLRPRGPPRVGCVPANVQQYADGDEPDAERGPAVRDKGQREARHGHQARDHRHVHPGLGREPHRDPGRDERAGRILGADRDTHAAVREDEEEHDDRERSGEPELVAEHGEDGGRVRRGEAPELLAPRAKAFAERAAQREPVERLDRLEAGAARVGPRVEEREETLRAIRLHERAEREKRDGDRGKGAELAEARSGDEVDAERDDHDDDRRPEVRLDEHEPGDHGRDGEEPRGDRPRAERLAARTEPRPEIEDERELRDLGRLYADELAEAEPARRAARTHADPRDQHEDEQQDREREERDGERAVAVVADARGHDHPRDAEGGPGGLLREEIAWVLERVERPDTARAVHHGEAKQRERDHDEDERQVVRRRAGHSQLHAFTPVSSRTSATKRSPRSSTDVKWSSDAPPE